MAEFKSVTINKGNHGWGGPLTVRPDEEKKYVISVTGGGIDPVAQKIADLTGAEVVDAFKNPVPKEQTFAAVIDCGGTARSGVYPKMGIPTINTIAITPAGPLAKFIKDSIFVSGVTADDIEENSSNPTTDISEDAAANESEAGETRNANKADSNQIESTTGVSSKDEPLNREKGSSTTNSTSKENFFMRMIDAVGSVAGDFVNTFYQAGRDTIDTLIKNVLPFMAFVATLVGIINYSGIGKILANILSPLAGNIIGLVVLSLICALPFLSPILGPAGVIAAVVGTLIGQQIATGIVPIQLALPALFAIDSQVGADFIPVGLTLGEAQPETISSGAPAILFSRLITAPIAVLIAYAVSFLL
ncbi:PTS glucitol/sorbitol transporter subunit IIB [Lactobacillus paracasei subsp. paracasei]|uniref:PTS glucitol/sorbitol transporter subunit IIB n=1 Tax=Lacticaseibacillus paracasei TaxID=1597 RepID=UPI0018C667F0|nr:PTS glucitol/sorbitol transporter subunit IIB [Lacticaseibacillus paracasei]MBG1273975.1 PTS glucitol/sorbitol transporter subunit IIB [Lacticaseibacillus paracasei subsp. paracasei]